MDNPAYENSPSKWIGYGGDCNHGNSKSQSLPSVGVFKTLDEENDNRWKDQVGKTQQAEHHVYPYYALFRYTSAWDHLLVALAIATACLGALGIPYAVMMYGEFTSLLIDRSLGVGTSSPTTLLPLFGGGMKLTNASFEENMSALRADAIAYGVGSSLGAFVELLLLAIAVNFVNSVALKQITKVRELFLEAILRQEMTWYDTTTDNNFATNLADNLSRMKDGMGEAVVIFTFYIMTFVWSVVVSFIYGWELTLVVLTCCPFVVLSTALVARIQSTLTEKELKAYSVAGVIAEEVFASIRTVFAFSGEQKEVQRYGSRLDPAERKGQKKGLYSGIGGGAMWFVVYCSYAIALWYGVKLILAERWEENRNYTPAVLLFVLFGVIMGAQSLGFSSPFIESFAVAKAACQNIFTIIDRPSAIDPFKSEGLRPKTVVGDIEFDDVHFRYPARADVHVLKGLSLRVKAGQTVAFVGPSGCGKSTILQLLQRFYDLLQGQVRLDGHNVRTLNVSWLRSQIGVVGQEPVLFATTIEENIRYGWPDATQSDIEQAARMANCHDFISRLPKGYGTMVGERGAQLSGGQKQRIAIARALVRNPRVLLLDEATSALDPPAERRVQYALEVASKSRTTLMVSHRLSTVTNADLIVFLKNGVVAEQGTHKELMARRGLYWDLVKINQRKAELEGQPDRGLQENEIASLEAKEKEDLTEEDDDEVGPVKNRSQRYDNTGSVDAKIAVSPCNLKAKEVDVEKINVSFMKILKLNAPEWRFLVLGCIAASLHGATFPVWALVFGDSLGMFSNENNDEVLKEAQIYSLILLGIGVVAGLGTLAQSYMFSAAGAKLTTRLRKKTFKTLLDQDVAYFDDDRNSVGALCARLAGDCSTVQGATGVRIGVIVQAISCLLIGIVVALFVSWRLTLVTLLTIPFVCIPIILESRIMESSIHKEKLATERASQVAVEAISNIRTVASLGLEAHVHRLYCAQIEEVRKASQKRMRFRGLLFGLGQTSAFYAYSLTLLYGGFLVADGKISYDSIIKVAEALIFASWTLGQTLAYAPNVSAAINSAGRLLQLFERMPAIQGSTGRPHNSAEESSRTRNPQDMKLNVCAQKLEGDITYADVDFHYPNRKDVAVLRQLKLTIASGTTTALVGPSGSGKSTCVQLLLRYYDPVSGSVRLGGTPTTDFPFDSLRSQMGLVSQEPVLFDRTIAENIAYGDNFRTDIPMTEIIAVAKMANIHQFVVDLPQGYDTQLGSKGAQLSGGQKQRIAIARALVRNPKILVLDEATSALDLESEKVVQQALDVARNGRTCLVIAHRLTTVRDADMICVLQRGVIVEQGKHDQLMARNGIYTKLYAMQQVA